MATSRTLRPETHARRTKLLRAAVEVIAENGVNGTTHRAVAARAGMPLSTTSYFFDSMDDLIAAALQVVADDVAVQTEERISLIENANLSPDDARDLFIDMILATPQAEVVSEFEIYLQCTRQPALQSMAHQIQTSFERTVEAGLRALGVARPAERAPVMSALIDGLALHRCAWPRGERDRRVLREAVTDLYNSYVEADRRMTA